MSVCGGAPKIPEPPQACNLAEMHVFEMLSINRQLMMTRINLYNDDNCHRSERKYIYIYLNIYICIYIYVYIYICIYIYTTPKCAEARPVDLQSPLQVLTLSLSETSLAQLTSLITRLYLPMSCQPESTSYQL